MKSLTGLVCCTLVVVGVAVATASGAPKRAANCAGYCLGTDNYVGWSFDGQFHARSNASASKPWLRLSNVVQWKLTLGRQFHGTRVAAAIHLGAPGKPGRLLAVLCGRCRSTSRGTARLSDQTLAAIFTGVPLGGSLPVHAYVELRTSTQTLRRQLSDA